MKDVVYEHFCNPADVASNTNTAGSNRTKEKSDATTTGNLISTMEFEP